VIDDKPSRSPRILWSKKFAENYLKYTNRLLDVGCGVGSYTCHVDAPGSVGIDLQLNALRTAKKYCTQSQFVVASASNLPFRNETFDLICMWEVIEHLPRGAEIEVMIEARKILGPGATLLLSTPNHHLVSNIMDPALFLRGHRHYDINKLIQLINHAGFFVIQSTIRGGLNTLLATNIFYFAKHVLHTRNGKLHSFFERRSQKEYNLAKGGIVNIFIAAGKLDQD
jgi:ubiquinone/menaquinone biosynthesis C-methylase UbiE